MEFLIKELLDSVAGVDWSPGTYPQSLARIKERPAAAWGVVIGSGSGTSTVRQAIIETTITISLWAGTAEVRMAFKDALRELFAGTGFLVQLPSDTEMTLDSEGKQTAYVSNMSFKGWIDTQTGWVYQNNG
ncbi:MAG: hypothetical protein VB049_11705 [Candidatus Pelethousia sp.]|nr:hypothetical protein [Candidatus Pelethousia sp.]